MKRKAGKAGDGSTRTPGHAPAPADVPAAFTLHKQQHVGLRGPSGVGGGAAVLSGVGQLHVGNPDDAPTLDDARPQSSSDFAPCHLRLGVTQGQALELHGMADHHGLHGGPDVDEHRGQGWGVEAKAA